MSDVGAGEGTVAAVEVLKASFRGVLRAADPLGTLRERVEVLSPKEPPDAALLSELARVGAGVAVAAAALRSLSESFPHQDSTKP
jgi:hypothetical protein